MRTKLQALPAREQVAAAAADDATDARLARQLRRRSLALFTLLTLGAGAAVVIALRYVIDDRLATATTIVGAALCVGGFYALLIDRAQARWALAAAAAVGGAVAAVDQLLGHLE